VASGDIDPLLSQGAGETGRNWKIPDQAKNLALSQEPILILVDGMRLHFDDEPAGQGENLLQTIPRFEGR
jgi:hypothetical protein